jgi:soluble lytic murein transglycosylase
MPGARSACARRAGGAGFGFGGGVGVGVGWRGAVLLAAAFTLWTTALAGPALALAPAAAPKPYKATPADERVVEARDALRRSDRARLASLVANPAVQSHALAQWVEYWDLSARLAQASQSDLNAFYARWPGTYVEDRLRNDWLLELGRRQDWANVRVELPRFRMNDDREVTCYGLLARHAAGEAVRDAAVAAWMAQRDGDDGCAQLASTLFGADKITAAEVWRKARWATELNRPRAARQAAALIDPALSAVVQEIFDKPSRYLSEKARVDTRAHAELAAMAVARLAASDGPAAVQLMDGRWEARLPDDLAAWAWAMVAKQNAYRLLPEAVDQFERADRLASSKAAKRATLHAAQWSDDTLAWKARAALRADGGSARWGLVLASISAMSAPEQADPAWRYWKARALQAQAQPGSVASAGADPITAWAPAARELLDGIASPLSFYGQLALEDLGRPLVFPDRPAPLTAAEREGAGRHPALNRALLLIQIGLRNEGVREWNFTVSRMAERELLAAAQLACDQHVWDRCINTSERTRSEIDLAQRFPMPFRDEVLRKSSEIGLDPAFVYGLIRQESRFVMDARSSVGASGLMQVMPATAKWTAKKIGIPYTHDLITDRDTNLMLGTRYLKLVMDSFDGMHPVATAAYNAGPARSRRWRDGPLLDAAAWVEGIPFNETRDYVKKVLSNAASYAAVMGPASKDGTSLRARLGRAVGPRELGPESSLEKELP